MTELPQRRAHRLACKFCAAKCKCMVKLSGSARTRSYHGGVCAPTSKCERMKRYDRAHKHENDKGVENC